MVNGLFFDVLGCAALVQVQQDLQELVQAGSPALFLHPDVEQLVDPVLIVQLLFALDHVVVDVEAAEELPVIVYVEFLEILEAAAQRLFACEQRSRRCSPPPPKLPTSGLATRGRHNNPSVKHSRKKFLPLMATSGGNGSSS